MTETEQPRTGETPPWAKVPPAPTAPGVPAAPAFSAVPQAPVSVAVPDRLQRRLQRIREEVERNRTVGPTIPTWVLAVALVVIVGGFTALVLLA